MIDLVSVLVIVAAATLAIAVVPRRKEAVGFAAAAVIMGYGQLRGFYTADRAFQSISMPVLLILLSIGIFAEIFSASGVFEKACRSLAIRVRGNRRALVAVFLLFTYVASCFLNNLTCICVLLPIMIGAMRAVGMKSDELRPVIVGIVISSNLGGASTMIGDFPNVLISRSQGIDFLPFLYWMMPVCLLLTFVLLVLVRGPAEKPDWISQGLLVEMLAQQNERLPMDKRLFIPATVMFSTMLIGLVLTGWYSFPPELIAIGCAALCVWLLPRPQEWLLKVDVQSILFISCLFIFAGAIQATGALDAAAREVIGLTHGNPYYLSASVIALACVLTAVFSAGPTTAALIPVAEAMKDQLPGHMIWWCLSLGVLAGSSATLLSATAGPIAANILKARTDSDLTFLDFLRIGWKVASIFSVVSIGYIWLRL